MAGASNELWSDRTVALRRAATIALALLLSVWSNVGEASLPQVERTLEDMTIIALETAQLEEGACANQSPAQDLADGIDQLAADCEELNTSEPSRPDELPIDRLRQPAPGRF